MFEISIQGAGMARIDQVDVDQMKVGVAGAGYLSRLRAAPPADGHRPRHVDIRRRRLERRRRGDRGGEGPSVVRAQVTNSAKVDANGLVSVTLTGNPACTVKARGSANVVGCK